VRDTRGPTRAAARTFCQKTISVAGRALREHTHAPRARVHQLSDKNALRSAERARTNCAPAPSTRVLIAHTGRRRTRQTMPSDHADAKQQCAELRANAASTQSLQDLDTSGLRPIPSLKQVRTMSASNERTLACAWHPDSVHLVSIDKAGAAIMWDTRTAIVRQYFARPFATAIAVAPSPDAEDATTVALGGLDNVISICDMSINIKKPEMLATLPSMGESHDGMITALAFLGSKDTLLSAGGDGDLRLWSVSKASTTQVLRGHTKDVCGLAVQRDDQGSNAPRIASCSLDGTIRIWDTRAAYATHTFDSPAPGRGATDSEPSCVSFFPDGNTVAAGYSDGSINIFDTRSYGLMGTLTPTGKKAPATTGIQVSHSGRAIYTSHEDGSIGTWDPIGKGEICKHDPSLSHVSSCAQGPFQCTNLLL